MEVMRFGVRNDIGYLALRQDPALMQDDEFIVWFDLVEQMRGPQHAYALLADEFLDVGKDFGPRFYVQSDGRLIEQ